MENGKWKMEHGGRGQWRVASGYSCVTSEKCATRVTDKFGLCQSCLSRPSRSSRYSGCMPIAH